MKSELLIELIWKDQDMVEVQVTASNGLFAGVTTVYTTPGEILDFAKRLNGYPRSISQIEEFIVEHPNYDPYVYIQFKCIDGLGHAIVKASLKESKANAAGPAESSQRVCLIIPVEAQSINIFARDLRQLSENQQGNAKLVGLENGQPDA